MIVQTYGSRAKAPALFYTRRGGAVVLNRTDRPRRYRPDHDGKHRPQYERNKKIIFATQQYCALCGKLVDFSLKYPDPMCATVDHIIPIIKGGHPSDLDNMQLAHYSCNTRKGQGLKAKVEPKKERSNRALPLSADWKTF